MSATPKKATMTPKASAPTLHTYKPMNIMTYKKSKKVDKNASLAVSTPLTSFYHF